VTGPRKPVVTGFSWPYGRDRRSVVYDGADVLSRGQEMFTGRGRLSIASAASPASKGTTVRDRRRHPTNEWDGWWNPVSPRFAVGWDASPLPTVAQGTVGSACHRRRFVACLDLSVLYFFVGRAGTPANQEQEQGRGAGV